jgi:DNA-binding NtrC family response regulator
MQYASTPHPPLQGAEVATQIIREWAAEGLLPGRARRARAARESAEAPADSQQSTTGVGGPVVLDSYNLEAAERRLCERALEAAGSLVHAAAALGITRHSLKRRIVKLGIAWPREGAGS